jgi:hypothetical protein
MVKKIFYSEIFFLKENTDSDGIFENISFIKNEILKINKLFSKHVSKWPR